MSQVEAQARAKPEKAAKEMTTPTGAVTILIGYAAVIVALWGHMFLTMLERGVK